MSKSYYDILGVSKDASQKEIKKAFRKVAMECHPDRHPDDPEAEVRFKEANEAYETLSDKKKRKAYDNPERGFNSFSFTGRSRGARPSAGPDVQIRLDVPFMTAALGGDVTVTIPVWSSCESCDGKGRKVFDEDCHACGGQGVFTHTAMGINLQVQCNTCGGLGKKSQPCMDCNQRGQSAHQVEQKIVIPAGVDTGATLRFQGAGLLGRNGGPPGDLLIRLLVEPHEIFDRDGLDLGLDVTIDFPTAVLGGEVSVPTLEGKTLSVKIPPGTRSGQTMRLAGLGISRGGRPPGDQYINVLIDVPKDVSDETKVALENLRDSLSSE